MRWLKSKSILGAIALGVLGVLDLTNGDVDSGLTKLAAALSAIGLRHGMWKAQG